MKNRRPATKKQELTEKLVLERCVRIGLCVVLKNLVEEHTKSLGGDIESALARIETGLHKTASSIEYSIHGDNQNISSAVQDWVAKILNEVFRDVRKTLSPKQVH